MTPTLFNKCGSASLGNQSTGIDPKWGDDHGHLYSQHHRPAQGRANAASTGAISLLPEPAVLATCLPNAQPADGTAVASSEIWTTADFPQKTQPTRGAPCDGANHIDVRNMFNCARVLSAADASATITKTRTITRYETANCPGRG